MTDIKWTDVLGPLASSFAPVLGGLIAGPAGAAVGRVLGGAIASGLGVEPTPDAVSQAIQADQGKAADIMRGLGLDPGLVATLGGVEAVQLAQERIAAEDRASAREQTIELAKAASPIAWGAPIVSAVVTAGFLLLAILMLFRAVPDTQAFNLIIGAMIAAFTQVVAYWLGSSVGSRAKDQMIRELSADAAPAAQPARKYDLRPPVGRLQ